MKTTLIGLRRYRVYISQHKMGLPKMFIKQT